LEKIKSYFGVGQTSVLGPQAVIYKVQAVKYFSVLIDHLERYPLMTKKYSDYKLLMQAFQLIQRKEHLTPAGLQKILTIRAAMNNGLSPNLKSFFPDVVPLIRPEVVPQEVKGGN